MSPIFIGSDRSSQPRYRVPLLNGEPGTAQTIALMRQLIDDALADAQFVRHAIDIVRSVQAFDDLGELEALYNWVKRNIRFVKDPVTKEKLYPPQELLKIRAGDCDDIAMLLGALAMAVGYQARLITVSAEPANPQEFSHVYVEAEAPPGSGQWIPLDAARFSSVFGVEPPSYFRKRAWSLTDSNYQDLSGGRLRGSLSGYVGMGQAIDYNTLLQEGLTEIPAIIATAAGGSSSATTPQGTVQTAPAPPNPWNSFATPYTPGYGIPTAGYGSPGLSPGLSIQANSIWPWLLGLGAVLLLARGRF